ncbi:MAG TPA: cation-transporting P-type ATPase, partial [Methylomirabilota bacterium]|nr:cation-transporting P-type ATPase [Methylomirabilota bacterium]
MSRSPTTPSAQGQESKCLARSVAEALVNEPSLEAVTVDHARRTIAVATLGRGHDEEISRRITAAITQLQPPERALQCGLLAGLADCRTCAMPLTPGEQRAISIRRDGTSTTFARVSCPTAPRFWRWRDLPWPKVVQRDVEFLEHAEAETEEWKPQLAAAALCGALGLAGWLFKEQPLGWTAYALAYLAGGWFTAMEVWERLRQRAIDVHFLMLAVAAGSASIGAWGEGATLLFLFSLSGALEHYALGRTRREIRSLFKDAPKVATILDDRNQERETPVEQLRPGDRLLCKPGTLFPVDAEIVTGRTAADESTLTGESAPVEKAVGDTVLAGTLNLWGAVEAVVLRPASQSALQKIIHL